MFRGKRNDRIDSERFFHWQLERRLSVETPRDSCIVVVTVERGLILAGNTEAEWVSSTCDNFHERGSMDMK